MLPSVIGGPGGWRVSQLLLQYLKFDLRHALVNDSERLGRRLRNIDHATGHVRATVVDSDGDGPSVRQVDHAYPRSERQCAVCSGQLVWRKILTVRGLLFAREKLATPEEKSSGVDVCLFRLSGVC